MESSLKRKLVAAITYEYGYDLTHQTIEDIADIAISMFIQEVRAGKKAPKKDIDQALKDNLITLV